MGRTGGFIINAARSWFTPFALLLVSALHSSCWGWGFLHLEAFFKSNQLLFARAGGILVVLFGLYQLGAFGTSNLLGRERRLPFSLDVLAMSPLTALIMGFTFSFAWTPCVGPALASILLMAASASTKTMGFVLIGVYTLGFVLPFLAVGFFTTTVLEFF